MVYTFYAPRANSPQTALSAGINSTITTVNVIDGSLLPAGPNVCTIGHAVDAETIQYSTRSGNVLSGVVRGFDGTTAKTWNAGTIVSRVLTANDISSLQSAINNHATLTAVHNATVTPTANRLILRDAAGRAQVADGAAAADIATLGQTVRRSGDTMTGNLTAPRFFYGPIGFNSVQLPAGANPDTLTVSDRYESTDFLNRPPGIMNWALLDHFQSAHSPLFSTQTIYCFFNEREVYIRFSRDDGTGVRIWTPWRRMWHEGNAVMDLTRWRQHGRYYSSALLSIRFDSATPTIANHIYATPFLVGTTTQSFDRIAVQVNTSAAGNMRMGIYADNGHSYPGTLLFGSGDAATGTIGLREFIISQTLTPGLYWLACLFSHAPSVISTSATGSSFIDIGTPTVGHLQVTGFRIAFTYAALPATYPAGAAIITEPMPVVFVRRA